MTEQEVDPGAAGFDDLTPEDLDDTEPGESEALTDDPADDKAKKSAATLLVEIARERFRFGISEDGDPFAVPRQGPQVVLMLRGGRASLRGQLARVFFSLTGRAAAQGALADALLVVEGLAHEADPAPLHLRTARHDGALWLDLGDPTGRAVEITASGWSVVATPPVLFKRTALNGPLPEPTRGTKLDDLWGWLNISEVDRPLVAAWLVSVLFGDIPHPILGLFGEQGTGKTTALKLLALTLDPGPVPARKPPKDADSWVTAAAGSWVVGLDNLSDIPPWLSDSLCRAVTGDGDVRRRLYTDGDLAVFAFRRCLIINGIDLGAIRGDLAERLLPIDLARISDANRREEETLWPRWRESHPGILGAVLDLTVEVLARSPSVVLDSRPRMADFARVLATVDQALGTDGWSRYRDRQGTLASDSLAGDSFISAVEVAVRGLPSGEFVGPADDLLRRATPDTEGWRPPRGWPASARQVTTRLKRQGPVMRKAGWTVDHDEGRNRSKVWQWTIAPPAKPETEMTRRGDPQDPRDPQSAGQGAILGDAARPAADPQTHGLLASNPQVGTLGAGQLRVRTPGAGQPRVSEPDSPGDESAGHGAVRGSAGLAGHLSGSSQAKALPADCRSCGKPLDPVLAERWHRDRIHPSCMARDHA